MKRVAVIGLIFVVGLVPLVGATAGFDPAAILDGRASRPGLIARKPLLQAIPAARALAAPDAPRVDPSVLATSARARLGTAQWLLLAGVTALLGVNRRRLPR